MALILNGTDNSATTPAVTGGTGGTGTGVFYPATNQVALATNGTTAVTVDASQNVGIGTSSPAQKLTVSGTGTLGSVYQIRGTNGSQAINFGANATAAEIQSTGGVPLYLNYGGNDVVTGFSGGNLLVGTTNADPTSGGLALRNTSYLGGAGWGLITSSTSTSNSYSGYFRNPNGAVGAIITSGSSTTYTTSSDYRLKENIAPMTGALATISALKPVTYKWKADGSNGQGFIAHELQAVVPDCVIGKKDAVETVDDVDAEGKVIGTKEVPVYQGIDTSFLVATLTAAIQELNAKVDAQAERIIVLEEK
jgi:hypothetical protein